MSFFMYLSELNIYNVELVYTLFFLTWISLHLIFENGFLWSFYSTIYLHTAYSSIFFEIEKFIT